MAMLSVDRGHGHLRRNLEVDLRNLLANPLAFTAPIVVILLVNLSYLNAIIETEEPASHLLPVATMLLLGVLFNSLLSIPFEIKEGYGDRIQIEFGSLQRRLAIRIATNGILGATLVVGPYLFLSIQNFIPHLTLNFDAIQLLLLFLATIYVTATATLIGSLYRNYLALSISSAALLVLQVSRGFAGDRGWAFSTLIERLLSLAADSRILTFYSRSIFLDIQIWIIATSAFSHWLNRGRGGMKSLRSRPLTSSRFQREDVGQTPVMRMALALKQITSIESHMKLIPFTLFLFALYPIINAEDAFSELPIEIKRPIVVSMIVTALFSALISIGSYKLTQEEQERDALSFGGISYYRRYLDGTYIALFTVLGMGIFTSYEIFCYFWGNGFYSKTTVRPFLIILLSVPIFSNFAREITNLNIDIRFFVLFATVIPFGEMLIASFAPELISFLPSSILAHLAGGEGLYQILNK
ncbi:hypothetical protein MCEJIRE27_00845 [Candidatus Nanopelagicaceae bacterium]